MTETIKLSLNRWTNNLADRNLRNGTNDNWDQIENGVNQVYDVVDKKAEEIVSSTQKRLDSLNTVITVGKNIFNKETVISGKYVMWHTGELGDSASYSASDLIAIQPNTTYSISRREQLAFYDKDKKYITGLSLTGAISYTFVTPSNSYYIRISTQLIHLDSQQLELGSKSTAYESFKLLLNENAVNAGSIQDGSISKSKLSFKPFTPDTKSKNLFNKDTAISGKYVAWNNGQILAPSNGKAYHASDFIEINSNTTYSISRREQLAFYDSNKVYVSGLSLMGSTPYTFVTPSNARFIRITTESLFLNEQQLEIGAQSTDYESFGPFISQSQLDTVLAKKIERIDSWDPLKWNVLGDSLTDGYGAKPYHKFVKEEKGIGLVRNYGVVGSTIANKEPGDWWTTNSMLTRMISMDKDADIVTIMGGTNDCAQNIPIGVMEDRIGNTFYGACHLLLTYIMETYVGKKVGVILPIQGSGGTKLQNYNNALREVSHYYGIPVLDLYNEGGINIKIEAVKNALMQDGLHPNDFGHEVISRRVSKFIEML